jgi:hypothetical protein
MLKIIILIILKKMNFFGFGSSKEKESEISEEE